MALTEFKHLYEILLRFDGDGNLQGAHAQYLEGVKKDGTVISATPGHAIPLSLVPSADKPTLTAAIGEAAEALLVAKEAAEAEAAGVKAEFKAKDANIQALLTQVEDLTNERDALASALATLEAQQGVFVAANVS